MNIYFTSDQHFGHSRILTYCRNSQYDSVIHMNKDMIAKYNQIVKQDDVCFMLGDFSLSNDSNKVRSYLKQLNGTKHLILGNHDALKPFNYIDCGFTSVHTSLTLEGMYLAHDPAVGVALQEGATLLHGHVHGLYKQNKSLTDVTLINVGVDVWDMKPVSIEQIKDLTRI